MKVMSRQEGSINILLIPLIVSIVLFFAALIFGLWAYAERQDYKNNVDGKVATAVEIAEKEVATQKDNEFIEREKEPLKEYKGPDTVGAVLIKYPKTWSAYVSESGQNGDSIDGYFHPNFVPGTQSDTAYALRLEVVNSTYASELKSFDSSVRQGKTRARPYKPVNVENVVGTQLSGDIGDRKTGVLILLPLRDKTIRLWTESDQYTKDFTKNILPNFSYTP